MKPAEQTKHNLVAQWLARAREDLGVAEQLIRAEVPYPNAVGFHCQQAVEKLMKSVLVAYQVPFPKTHDLDELLRLVSTVDESLAASLDDVSELNPYSVEFRYPGDAPDVTPSEARAALTIAMGALDLVLTALGQLKSLPDKG